MGVVLAALVTVTVSGCTPQIEHGWLPTERGTTNQTNRIMDLWNGSWIAALCVGVLVWGLTIWCMVAYRRRRGETGFPPQIRYHLPLEILYTVVPIMMVAVLFGYTYRDQTELISTEAKPDVTIGVFGKQWAWDFNYLDAQVYETGVQGQLNGRPGVEKELPTLYLPVDKRVQFNLITRDVNHSFWIPAFLMKMDLISGIQNKFQVVPQRIGTFRGKCAELCGEYHSEMLFNVKVVSQQDYEAHLAALRAQGNVGELGVELNREGLVPGSDAEEAGNSDARDTTGNG